MYEGWTVKLENVTSRCVGMSMVTGSVLFIENSTFECVDFNNPGAPSFGVDCVKFNPRREDDCDNFIDMSLGDEDDCISFSWSISSRSDW